MLDTAVLAFDYDQGKVGVENGDTAEVVELCSLVDLEAVTTICQVLDSAMSAAHTSVTHLYTVAYSPFASLATLFS